MYKKNSTQSIQQHDLNDNRREYNECALEVKKENPFIGSIALHQEAMKLLSQRHMLKQKKSDSSVPSKKRMNLYNVSKMLRSELGGGMCGDDDDDSSIGDKSSLSISSGFESLSNYFLGDDSENVRHFSPAPGLTRLSIDSLTSMFKEVGSKNMTSTATMNSSASGEMAVIRRRGSVVSMPDFDENLLARTTMQRDLELPDSSDDSSVLSIESFENLVQISGSLRRNSESFRRRASNAKAAAAARKSRRGCSSIHSGQGDDVGCSPDKDVLNPTFPDPDSSQAPFTPSEMDAFCENITAFALKESPDPFLSGHNRKETALEKKMPCPHDDCFPDVSTTKRKPYRRRSSLASVEENIFLPKKDIKETFQLQDVLKIQDHDDPSIGASSCDSQNDGSLICGWARTSSSSLKSFDEEEDYNSTSGALICSWAENSDMSFQNNKSHKNNDAPGDDKPAPPHNVIEAQNKIHSRKIRGFKGFDLSQEI